MGPIPRDLKPYVAVMAAVEATASPLCEVVLHDLRRPGSSLIAIAGNLTGRCLGAPVTDLVLAALRRRGDEAQDLLGYLTLSPQGDKLRASTTFIRDHEGTIIGCFCFNFKLSLFEDLRDTAQDIVGQRVKEPLVTFSHSIPEEMGYLLQKIIREDGLNPTQLTKSARRHMIKKLDEAGAFLVKGAVAHLTQLLKVSQSTIYHDLSLIRSQGRQLEDAWSSAP